MSSQLPALFLANWKMNMLNEQTNSFASEFDTLLTETSETDVGIAPPLTALATLKDFFAGSKKVLIGSQNVHWLESGAHTGEVSASMLKEFGVDFAIVGHSERRQFYGETSKFVAQRALAAVSEGIMAVICVGESKEEFESGSGANVVKMQLHESLSGFSPEQGKNIVIAYEPVWAIGTGLAATPEQASEMHDMIREELKQLFSASIGEQIKILYGGSTKPSNIEALMHKKNINGALVGGASLVPETFASLIEIGRKANSN